MNMQKDRSGFRQMTGKSNRWQTEKVVLAARAKLKTLGQLSVLC